MAMVIFNKRKSNLGEGWNEQFGLNQMEMVIFFYSVARIGPILYDILYFTRGGKSIFRCRRLTEKLFIVIKDLHRPESDLRDVSEDLS